MKHQGVFYFFLLFLFLNTVDLASAQLYRGKVIDEYSRKPVPYVTVSLQNEDNEHIRHTSTDEEGQYLLVAPEPSNYYVHVKRIGYSENIAGPYYIETGDTLNIVFRIMEVAESLGEITVEGTPYEEFLTENYLKANNFYTRKKRGIGQFMTKKEIEDRKAIETSALFTGIHGIKRFYSNIGPPQLLNQHANCAPKIIINGMTLTSSSPLTLSGSGGNFTSVDFLVNVDNLVGMEVYTSLIGQPAAYGPKSRCGAIVFWTR